MRFLPWLRRAVVDVAIGTAVLTAGVAIVGLVVGALTVVFSGPTWGRWAILAPLIAFLLAHIGRGMRSDPAPRDRPEPTLLMRPRLPISLDKTDDELRAMGITNPAALREMGPYRYFAARERVFGASGRFESATPCRRCPAECSGCTGESSCECHPDYPGAVGAQEGSS